LPIDVAYGGGAAWEADGIETVTAADPGRSQPPRHRRGTRTRLGGGRHL